MYVVANPRGSGDRAAPRNVRARTLFGFFSALEVPLPPLIGDRTSMNLDRWIHPSRVLKTPHRDKMPIEEIRGHRSAVRNRPEPNASEQGIEK